MEYNIELKFSNETNGGFYIFDNGKQIAELEFQLDGHELNAYHTGVIKEMEGKGIAGELFNVLVKYARENHYRIVPSCSYILVKFKRNPAEFSDIWIRKEDEPTGEACGIKPKQ